mgnify:CR=1 FL=1
MLYREYPEKSFKSFSLLANALPIGIPAEGLDLGILQPEIGILQPDWYSSDSWGIGFPEGYFRLKHFTMHILQPECRWAGVCGMAERSEGKIRRFGM